MTENDPFEGGSNYLAKDLRGALAGHNIRYTSVVRREAPQLISTRVPCKVIIDKNKIPHREAVERRRRRVPRLIRPADCASVPNEALSRNVNKTDETQKPLGLEEDAQPSPVCERRNTTCAPRPPPPP